jgi:hypothetical protein
VSKEHGEVGRPWVAAAQGELGDRDVGREEPERRDRDVAADVPSVCLLEKRSDGGGSTHPTPFPQIAVIGVRCVRGGELRQVSGLEHRHQILDCASRVFGIGVSGGAPDGAMGRQRRKADSRNPG